MPYVICEKCSGYYELEEGESPKDFDSCQCGGKLDYVDSIKIATNIEMDSVYKNTDNDIETKKEEEITLYCSNCGNYDSDGIYCSKCGGKLVTIKNGKIISTINSYRNSKESEELLKRSRKINNDYVASKDSKDLFERISWLGVGVGIGSFVISFIILTLIIAFSFISKGYYPNFDSGIIATLIIYILILLILITGSGGLAAFLSKSRDYIDGAINGLLVGVICGIIIGIFSGISTILFGILIYGTFATFGGVIGILIRKKFK